MFPKACAVEASPIDASIPEWNSMCAATCGASTTKTGGSSSDNCANNADKRKTRVRMKFFFSVFPTSQSKIAKIELRTQFWRVFSRQLKFRIEKNVGISNDFDMTHVARNANYQGSLTTPVPCFFRDLDVFQILWDQSF